MDGETGPQVRVSAESIRAVFSSGLIESKVQAVGALDSSVLMEAHNEFPNMSTPRTGDLGPVN